MKISIYITNSNNQGIPELKSYEVTEDAFARIANIIIEYGSAVSSEVYNTATHVIINNAHCKVDNVLYYDEIKKILEEECLKQLEVDNNSVLKEETQENISIFADNHNDFESEINKIGELIEDCNFLKFYEEIKPIADIKNAFQNITALRQFPQLIDKYNYAACTNIKSAIDKIKDNLILPAIDIESSLILKEQLGEYSTLINNIILAIDKINTFYFTILNNKHFNESLEEPLQPLLSDFVKNLITPFLTLQKKLKSQIQRIDTRLANLEENRLKNSIIIRTWRNPGGEGRTIAGLPSGDHSTVELFKNNQERIYLSYYPKQYKEQTWVGNKVKEWGYPSTDDRIGKFKDLEYDLKKGFQRCDIVVISCTQPGTKLDFDAAYAWAQGIQAKYTKYNSDGTKFLESDDYNFYRKNCAFFAANALEAAKSGKYVKYCPKFTVDTPEEVYQYALKLKSSRDKLSTIYKEENEIQNSNKSDKDKYLAYFQYALNRLNLLIKEEVLNKDELSILNDIIKKLNNINRKIKFLHPDEVQKFIAETSQNIYQSNTEISKCKLKDDLKEKIIGILKHLTELLPIQEMVGLKVITAELQFNVINSTQTLNQPSPTRKQVEAILAMAKSTLNNKSMVFDNALRIKYALLQLNKLHEADIHHRKITPEVDKFDRETFKFLKKTLGQLNESLYFNPAAAETNQEKNVAIALLQKIFPPDFETPEIQLNIKNLIQNAMGLWVKIDPTLKEIKKEIQSKIINAASNDTPPLVEKPNVFAFWEWPKRHQHFELETKAKIYRILNDDKLKWHTKIDRINKLVEDHKPNLLAFWRRSEQKRYDEMGAKAILICLLQAFIEGDLSEAPFIAEIDKLSPSLIKKDSVALNQLRTQISLDYEENIKDTEVKNKESAIHLRIFKETLKQAVTDIEHTFGKQIFFEPKLDTYLFAGACYKKLKTKNGGENKVNTFGFFDQVPQDKQIKNRVTAEVKLWEMGYHGKRSSGLN